MSSSPATGSQAQVRPPSSLRSSPATSAATSRRSPQTFALRAAPARGE
jgi:hypothetical protein